MGVGRRLNIELLVPRYQTTNSQNKWGKSVYLQSKFQCGIIIVRDTVSSQKSGNKLNGEGEGSFNPVQLLWK